MSGDAQKRLEDHIEVHGERLTPQNGATYVERLELMTAAGIDHDPALPIIEANPQAQPEPPGPTDTVPFGGEEASAVTVKSTR